MLNGYLYQTGMLHAIQKNVSENISEPKYGFKLTETCIWIQNTVCLYLGPELQELIHLFYSNAFVKIVIPKKKKKI